MRYMGSKNRYAKYIVPILQKVIDDKEITTYIEPFVGSASIVEKINCENRYGYDRSDTLIALLKQAQENPDEILKEGNRELWNKGKAYVKDGVMPKDMSLADIGAMEFFASYCAGGFPRGYVSEKDGRDPFQESRDNLVAQAPNLKGIIFNCQNYWELDENISNAVILNDPPYQGTQEYGYKRQPKMDYNHFWNWVRKLSVNNYVFTCEESAPEDFNIIWQKEVNRFMAKSNNVKTTEKLYVWSEGLASKFDK